MDNSHVQIIVHYMRMGGIMTSSVNISNRGNISHMIMEVRTLIECLTLIAQIQQTITSNRWNSRRK